MDSFEFDIEDGTRHTDVYLGMRNWRVRNIRCVKLAAKKETNHEGFVARGYYRASAGMEQRGSHR